MDPVGIRSTSDLSQAASFAAASARQELGRTEFMELLVAQFNNQNPLEPTKNEDFIAQLAQFSSLEGIQNLNLSVESMAAAMRSSSTMQAAGLVGRSVLAPADRALTDGSGIAGNIVNERPGADLVVEITGGGGELLKRLPLGPQPEGDVRFLWDGTGQAGEQLPAGTYGVRAFAVDGDESAQLTVELPEVVASVSFEDDGATLNLAGGASVALAAVRELQ